MRTLVISLSCMLASACAAEPDAALPGNTQDETPFAGIAEDESIRMIGTEPFWGGEIAGDTLVWSTPDNPDGVTVEVARFAGRGGLAFSGSMEGQQIDIAITPAACSDGMSDRVYPLVVTVQLAAQQLDGCGWSNRQRFTGGE